MTQEFTDYDDYENAEAGPEKTKSKPASPMAQRFRGYLPVVVDVETGGFNSATDALLKIAVFFPAMEERGLQYLEHSLFFRVGPYEGANTDPPEMELTGINLEPPLRMSPHEE